MTGNSWLRRMMLLLKLCYNNDMQQQLTAPQRFLLLVLIGIYVLSWLGTVPYAHAFAPLAQNLEQQLPATLDSHPFGLNTHLATRYTDPDSMDIPADIVAGAQVGWAREDIHWYRIQPTPDTWDWTYTDNAMRALIQRDIHVLGVIGHPPGWATPYPGDEPDSFSFYAPDPDQFAAFAQAVAVRYSRYISHWEIWNEPDNPLFWKPQPDAQAYATMLVRAATAIKTAVPNAQVVLGGVNPFDTQYLQTIAEQGAWDSFDILGIHPYVDPGSPEAGNILAATEGIRALSDKYGNHPIWVTEVGWRSRFRPGMPGKDLSEENQANYLIRSTLLLWRAGVERIFWYNLKDDPDGDSYGLVGYGNGRADYSPGLLKPSYYAFQTMSNQLENSQFVDLLDLYDHTPVIDFENFGVWIRGDQANGRLSPTTVTRHSGQGAAQLSYQFVTEQNDYVVFRRDRAAPIPGSPYAIGAWVYGDNSGHTLKLWLRDSQNEVLQFTLGSVGPEQWRFLQTQIDGSVPEWDRITTGGNGRLDMPARMQAIVLDDAPDQRLSSGTIYLDDITVLSGPEAYDLRLQSGSTSIDMLWSPIPMVVSIATQSRQALLTQRDGRSSTIAADKGRIVVQIGPAPIFVRHQR